MRISSATAATLARINRGDIITDIGGIDPATRRALRRLHARGYLAKGESFAFPRVKTAWAGARYWDVAETMPAEFKFFTI